MPTILKTKNSVTTTVVPTTLVQGELAVNITDKKMWVGNAASSPVQILGAGTTGTAAGSNTQVQYNSSGTLAGSSNFVFDGTNVGIGTSSPAVKTEIYGTAAASNLALRITNTATDGYSTLQMGDANAGVFRNGSAQSLYGGASSLNLITVGAHPIGFATGNTLRAIIDSSGQLLVGTTTALAQTTIYKAGSGFQVSSPQLTVQNNVADGASGDGAGINFANATGAVANIASSGDGLIAFNSRGSTGAGWSERIRITSGGNFAIGSTTTTYIGATFRQSISGGQFMTVMVTSNSSADMIDFVSPSGLVGKIEVSGSSTSYVTSSDYRLKENIAPMIGALATVSALKPCTYTWKNDGSTGQGFIAHELQAVCPDAVSGEKDAVENYTDEDGNEQTRIKPQGIDTSFLVATLTAAIQELKAMVDAQAVEIAILKAK
jgi:hypothetical protein